MKSKLFFYLVLIFAFSSCKQSEEVKPSENLDNFNAYITSHSRSPVSRCENLFVQLNFKVPESITDYSGILNIYPSVGGQLTLDPSRRRFILKNAVIEHNVKYKASFNIGSLTTTPIGMKNYDFIIESQRQVWDITMEAPQSVSMDAVSYHGKVNYADCEPNPMILNRSLKAYQDGKELNIYWNHKGAKSKYSTFQIGGIVRKNEAETVELKLDMNTINVDDKAEMVLPIPSKSDFSLHSIEIEANKHVKVYFTDPLLQTQNVNGLITCKSRKIKRTEIEGNCINLYFEDRAYGDHTIEIIPGIKNLAGFELKDDYERSLFFAPLKPKIQIAEKGNILPPTGQWNLPVSIVSATGFRLRILKVSEKNSHRFYQENAKELKEQRGLENIGRIILDTIYDLNPSDAFISSYHSIDLSRTVQKEMGALYKVFLSIPQEHNAYPCDEESKSQRKDFLDRMNFDSPGIRFGYNDYYYEEDYNYYGNATGSQYYSDNYREYYQDPCTENFSTHIHDQRLLICSDVGIIFKSEPDNGQYFSYVSRITDAGPIPNATVRLYNFQGDEIAKSYTDGNGMATIKSKEKPYLVKASASSQHGYLPVSDAKALSLSSFQVEGKKWSSAEKLFFYADREVWRPGDTIYMHAIVFNEDKPIPSNLPVNASLFDPQNKLVKKWTIKENAMGLYDCRFSTDLNAPTGYWRVELKLGSETYSNPVRVETIRPNRLKMNMEFADQKLIKTGMPLDAPIFVKWMHGLEAKELETELSMMQKQIYNPFGANYANYLFNDLTKSYAEDLGQITNGTTNKEGKLDFTIPVEDKDSYPSMMLFNFNLRSFEKGGAFSTDMKSIKYSPYEAYVGIKLPGGEQGNHLYLNNEEAIQLVGLDQDGNAQDREVEISLSRLDNQWWYQFGNSGNYAAIKSNIKETPVKYKVNTGKSGTTFSIKERGRLFLTVRDVKSGHTVTRSIYSYNPNYWNDDSEEVSQLEVLPFTVEKNAYNVGELINFDLPPIANGRYLVTIESGGKLSHAVQYQSTNYPQNISIPVTREMAPTAYVHVHLVQAWNTHLNDRPLRLFGVKPIKVFDPNSILKPRIDMTDEIRADESFTVNISESNSKRMAYTLAVVDEGLLDITQFSTPKPWNAFFGKERLNVKTWDMYRDIFHRFLGEYTTLLAVGGDGSNAISPTAKARRFKPVVKFLGPFVLEAGQTVQHALSVDDYVGSVRVMLVATAGTAIGHTEKTVPVTKPLMLYATLPRVLGPGEKLKLPVTVFAMKEGIKEVAVELKTEDGVRIAKSNQLVNFDKIGEQDIAFDIEIDEIIGTKKFIVKASTAGFEAEETIELDVRPSSPIISKTVQQIIPAGQSVSLPFEVIGMKGTESGNITVSKGLNFSFEPHVDWLSRYPHGCLEQTISSIFPQIYLYQMNLLDETNELKYRQQYEAAMQRLRFMQLPKGGFSYWPGGNTSNSWGTSYTLNYLLEAKKMGYSVPDDMINKCVQHQYKAAEDWRIVSSNNSRYMSASIAIDQAYRLYTLVLAGKPNYAAMNRLRLAPQISPSAKWLLAHAMYLVGEESVADQILKSTTQEIDDYRELSGSFGSALRDQAIIARILMERGDKLTAKRVIDEMAEYFAEDRRWRLNTQEVSQCLITFAQFVSGLENVDQAVKYTLLLDNAEAVLDSVAKSPNVYELNKATLANGKLELKNEGEAEIYAAIQTVGLPMKDESNAINDDLSLSINYIADDGSSLNPAKIKKGTDFTVEYKVTHSGARMDYDNMALTSIFPSGWEIINSRLISNSNFDEGDSYDYKDVRDDRVMIYFNLAKAKSKTFRIKLNATYEGEYWAPPVFCEAMYDATIRAKNKGFNVEVVKQ